MKRLKIIWQLLTQKHYLVVTKKGMFCRNKIDTNMFYGDLKRVNRDIKRIIRFEETKDEAEIIINQLKEI